MSYSEQHPGETESERVPAQTNPPALKVGKAMRERLEKRRWVRFWGQRRMQHVVFVPTVLGDGLKMLAVQPLNTRPNYYLLRIDSSWHTSNYKSPCVADNMDDIYEAIEEYVGPKWWTDDNGRERCEVWPALDDDCGSSWWDATDYLKLPRRKKSRG